MGARKNTAFFYFFASLGLGAFREAAGKLALSLAGRSNPDRLHPVQPRQSHGVLTTSCFLIFLLGFSSVVIKRAVTHKMEGPKPGPMGKNFLRNNSVKTSIKPPVISIFVLLFKTKMRVWNSLSCCKVLRCQCLFIQN